jgi:predicted Rossmann fold flavoprotein
MLLAECAAAGARIQLSTRVLSISEIASAQESAFRFSVETTAGPIRAQSLVIATGGLSIPKLGATSFGYDLARQFNHPIIEPRPALVPLVFSPEDQVRWCDLTGLSTEVIGSTAAPARQKPAPLFREKMLITHRGLSGPAILQISSYWHSGQAIELDLAPGQGSVFAPLTQLRARRDFAAATAALRSVLPVRMATRWMELHANNTSPQTPLSNAALTELDRELHAWRVIPAGTEGFAKAEVTAGGVSTEVLDARTMQSRLVPGLYFIGEVVDVTGWLGGYNFQWAWASAFAAAQSV